MFKCIKGKNSTTPFLPLNCKNGGSVRYVKDRKAICLTQEQTRYIYKKAESGSEIKVDTMQQDIDNENLTATMTEDKEINPYQKVVLNNVYRDKIKTAQMEYWSILSDNVKYDKESKTVCDLDVKTLDYMSKDELGAGNSPTRVCKISVSTERSGGPCCLLLLFLSLANYPDDNSGLETVKTLKIGY